MKTDFTVRPLESLNYNKLAKIFFIGFAVLYSVIPSLWFQSILPDSAQNITWGHSWLWSYNRHPPLGTWLISFLCLIFGNNEIATFSASALCLSISLLFIYKLSKHYLSEKNALAACIISSFSLYYLVNFVLQFNQNTIMLPFWVMIGYFSDSCMRNNRALDWVWLSLVTAASLLAKYESMLIIMLVLFYLFRHFDIRFLSKLGWAFGLSLLLLLPHIVSVFQHGFLTLEFIHSKMEVGKQYSVFYTHLYYPVKALFEQFCHLLPALVTLLVCFKNKSIIQSEKENTFQFNYLVYLGIAPLILVLGISLIFGLKIQAEWGYPLFSFTIPALLSFFQLDCRASFLRVLIFIALIIHLGSLSIYKSVQYLSNRPTRTNYPSYTLASNATNYWQQFTKKPLKYVGGDEEIDYYLAAYLPKNPLLLENYSYKISPWLNQADLKNDGILLVMKGCDQEKNTRLKEAFSAIAYQCFDLPLSNNYHKLFYPVTLMVVVPKI